MPLFFFHALPFNGGEFVLVLGKHVNDNFGLDVSPLVKFWIDIILTLTLYKEPHVLVHEVHSQDVNYVGSFRRVFNQQQRHKVLEILWINVRNRILLILHDFKNKTEKVFGIKRVFESCQLVQDASKRPHVTFIVVRLWLANLRWHVVRRSLDGHSNVVCVFENFWDTKIAELDCVVGCQKNVLRLQIAVKHTAAVNVLER